MEWKARMPLPISEYTNSHHISNRFQLGLLRIIGQIFAFDGIPLFDTLVWGEPLNSLLQNLASGN